MKKLLIVLSAFAIGLTACNSKPAAEKEGEVQTTENGEPVKRKTGTKLKTVSDSISYAIGADYGRYVKSSKETIGADLNEKMIMKGIRDAIQDKSTLTPEEGFAYMQKYFTVIVPERNLAEGEKFLEETAKQPNVQKTESGLLYEIVTPGSDKRATSLMDDVRVKYRGTLKDGREFDSNYESADTARFTLNRVVKGWGEGLQLVGEGGKIKLYIPSELGYGKMGRRGTVIGPNEPLVFEVDVIEVIPAEPAQEDLAPAK